MFACKGLCNMATRVQRLKHRYSPRIVSNNELKAGRYQKLARPAGPLRPCFASAHSASWETSPRAYCFSPTAMAAFNCSKRSPSTGKGRESPATSLPSRYFRDRTFSISATIWGASSSCTAIFPQSPRNGANLANRNAGNRAIHVAAHRPEHLIRLTNPPHPCYTLPGVCLLPATKVNVNAPISR
jgi:hypothetical protein